MKLRKFSRKAVLLATALGISACGAYDENGNPLDQGMPTGNIKQQSVGFDLPPGNYADTDVYLSGQTVNTNNRHDIAVWNHNTYIDSQTTAAANLTATTTEITNHLNQGVNMIEIDIEWDTSVSAWRVTHDGQTNITQKALLTGVLAIPALKSSQALVSIEIKDTTALSTAKADALLAALWGQQSPAGQSAYAKSGRNLQIIAQYFGVMNSVKTRLALSPYNAMQAWTKFSFVMGYYQGNNDIDSYVVANNAAAGATYRTTSVDLQADYRFRSLFATANHARKLGLGVGLWNSGSAFPNELIAATRETFDWIGTEASSSVTRAELVKANSLLYFDTRFLMSTTDTTLPYRALGVLNQAPVGGTSQPTVFNQPTLSNTTGQYGLLLGFNGSQRVALGDLDNSTTGGYMVASAVRVNSTAVNALANGASMAIVSKEDEVGKTGFSLGIKKDSAGVKKFFYRAWIGGTLREALFTATSLNLSDQHFIVGAYSGTGTVKIWVNFVAGTSSASTSGGIGVNSLPVTVGANPHATAPTEFFNGHVQMVNVSKWPN